MGHQKIKGMSGRRHPERSRAREEGVSRVIERENVLGISTKNARTSLLWVVEILVEVWTIRIEKPTLEDVSSSSSGGVWNEGEGR